MHHIDFAMTSMVFVADRPRCPSCGEPMGLSAWFKLHRT